MELETIMEFYLFTKRDESFLKLELLHYSNKGAKPNWTRQYNFWKNRTETKFSISFVIEQLLEQDMNS